MSGNPPEIPESTGPAEQQRPQTPSQPAAPPMGGMIWLGIVIAVLVPVVATPAGLATVDSTRNYGAYWAYVAAAVLPTLLTIVLAIVLTCVRSTRRTGIGMWIGLAALPIIGFGVCTALVMTA